MPVTAPPRKATSSAGRDAAARRLGDARVGAHRDVHADVAGRRRTGRPPIAKPIATSMFWMKISATNSTTPTTAIVVYWRFR